MKHKKLIHLLPFLFITGLLVIFINTGYAGDHFGDYMNDQAPTKYAKATGWRKIVGNVMLFGILFYMARQIWKSWRDK